MIPTAVRRLFSFAVVRQIKILNYNSLMVAVIGMLQIYYIVANGDFELIKVGRYKRATKESFEKWYQNQTRYRLVAEDGQERR